MQSTHSTRHFLALISAVAFVSACTLSDQPTDSTASAELELDSLVTAQWLSEHLDHPDLVVLDCTVLVEPGENGGLRIVSGRANYESGHIPSAGFANLMGNLSDLDNSMTFVMPPPEQFADAMGALGVGEDSRVVLYSAGSPDWAARVWWMLRWVGFDRVAILDGGLEAWTADGRPLSTEPADRPAKQFSAALKPETIADRDQVFAAIDNSNVSLVDALPVAHYRGEFSMYARPGHILGATNLPSSDILDAEGHYWSDDVLEMMYPGDRKGRVITYCGGGVAASSVAFAMHRLGFTDVAVYMGSLQEWAADPANPMSVDAH
jgi:thiosulfate/3-mercaptopyruvate sulfurtransferase